jgi:hypothetical protein
MITVTIPRERQLLEAKEKELNDRINDLTLARAQDLDPAAVKRLGRERNAVLQELRFVQKAKKENKACLPRLSISQELMDGFYRNHQTKDNPG